MNSYDYIHFAGDWSESEREIVDRAVTEFEEKVGQPRLGPSERPKPLMCLKVQADGEKPYFAACRLGRDDMVSALTAKGLAAKIYRLTVFGSSEEVDEMEWRGGISRKRLRDVLEYVRSHLDDPIKVADMAERAHMSEAHFAREFKRSLGIAPMQYVTQCRVERAQQLLKHGDLKVGEIARQVGLPNASNFAKVFRDHVGMTPIQYRHGSG